MRGIESESIIVCRISDVVYRLQFHLHDIRYTTFDIRVLTFLCYTPLHLLFPFFSYGSPQQEDGCASAFHVRFHEVGGLHPALRFSSHCSRRCLSDTRDDELGWCCGIPVRNNELLARSRRIRTRSARLGEEFALLYGRILHEISASFALTRGTIAPG